MRTVRAADRRAAPPLTRTPSYFIAPHTGRSLTSASSRESCQSVGALLARARPRARRSRLAGDAQRLQTLRLLLGAMYGGYCVNPVNLLRSRSRCATCSTTPMRASCSLRRSGTSACASLTRRHRAAHRGDRGRSGRRPRFPARTQSSSAVPADRSARRTRWRC